MLADSPTAAHLHNSFSPSNALVTQPEPAAEFQELLRTLRIYRIDYILIRPYCDDRVFLCLSAALSTLQKWAEQTGMRARLHNFVSELEQKLKRQSAEIPHAKFKLKDADKFWPFCSGERIHLLTSKLQHKGQGGCSLDFNRMLHHDLVVDHFALHHQLERRLLYSSLTGPRTAMPIWPPASAQLFIREAQGEAAVLLGGLFTATPCSPQQASTPFSQKPPLRLAFGRLPSAGRGSHDRILRRAHHLRSDVLHVLCTVAAPVDDSGHSHLYMATFDDGVLP